MTLDAQIEAILFFKSEPISLKKLTEILHSDEEKVTEALNNLEQNLQNRGLQLVRKEDSVILGTHAEMGPIIEGLIKEELVKDIGKAGLETLSIILYKGPIARRDVDYIRGVNSNFIIRNLLVRGLVEKVQDEKDSRTFLYKPTFELLSYLGISKIEELPEYVDVRKEIGEYEKNEEAQESQNQTHE